MLASYQLASYKYRTDVNYIENRLRARCGTKRQKITHLDARSLARRSCWAIRQAAGNPQLGQYRRLVGFGRRFGAYGIPHAEQMANPSFRLTAIRI